MHNEEDCPHFNYSSVVKENVSSSVTGTPKQSLRD
jgi:hypothetical protein